MAQVNVEFDDDTVKTLDRIAAKQSIRRTELVRRMVRELIDADAAGREPFSVPVQEMRAEDLAHVAREHRQLAIELDRVVRQNVKREADLRKAIEAYERDAAAARERGEREVSEALEREVAPFRAEIATLKADLATKIGNQPRLDAMESTLQQVRQLASQPRTAKVYNIGLGDWSGGMLATAGVVLLVLGMFAYHGLAAALPERWLQIPSANRMLGGGDRAICRLIDYHYETGLADCRIRAENRTVTITSTLPRNGNRAR